MSFVSKEAMFDTIDQITTLHYELEQIERLGCAESELWARLGHMHSLLHTFFTQFLSVARHRPEFAPFATRWANDFSITNQRACLYINPVPDIDVKQVASFVNQYAEPLVATLNSIKSVKR